jgi:aspartyl-tRNA(Asn)/glutamyl-tRNA(Gln) amidotransferase subunit A
VRDVALLLEVIAGHDSRDAASLPVARRRFDATPGRLDRLKIGFSSDLGFAAVSPEVRELFKSALNALEDLGAILLPESIGIDPEVLEQIIKPIAYTEQAAAVAGRDDAALARSDREYNDVIARGRSYRGVDYVGAMHRRTQLRNRFVELFRRADVFVTPTVAVTAFEAGTLGVKEIDGKPVDPHLGWSPFSWPINLVGLPAATIPCGFDTDGLPVGLQVVAPWLEEARIFRVAAGFESARPWLERWPGFIVG